MAAATALWSTENLTAFILSIFLIVLFEIAWAHHLPMPVYPADKNTWCFALWLVERWEQSLQLFTGPKIFAITGHDSHCL